MHTVPGPSRRDRRADACRACRPTASCSLGFLPAKAKARADAIAEIAGVRATLVFYESGPRLGDTLAALREQLGAREAAVAREISKLHEECVTGTLAELAAALCRRRAQGRDRDRRRPAGRSRRGDATTSSTRRCDEALGRLSPSRAAAEVARAAEHPAQARLRPRARANRSEPPAPAEKRGRRAETIACWWLRLHGWRILARRARVPGGEVDIVARRGRTLAFIEVKARATERCRRLRARRLSPAPRRRGRRAAGAALPARRRRHPHRRLVPRPRALAAALANVWQG